MKERRQMKDGAAWYSNLKKKRRPRIKIVTILYKIRALAYLNK
jgi:hypothetical protein